MFMNYLFNTMRASVMSRPSKSVLNHLDRPQNAGRLENPDATGRSSLDGRAPYTHVYLKIHDQFVEQIGFETFGCAFTIAACSVLTELVRGGTLQNCLAIAPDQIHPRLGHVPEEKQFCAQLAVGALHDAIHQWQKKHGTNGTSGAIP